MSNSKFKSMFSPERPRSPQRVLSPDLEHALLREVGQLAKDTVLQELRAAVLQLANNSSKFFGNFRTSQGELWDESNPFLSNVPASLEDIVEEKLFCMSFPKHLQTMAMDNKISPSFAKQEQLKNKLS